MNTKFSLATVLLCILLAAIQPSYSQSGQDFQRNRRSTLAVMGLPGTLVAPPKKMFKSDSLIADPVALGLATAKVYKYATADYPGAALSGVFDTNASTAVGFLVNDPTSSTSPYLPFTLNAGVYRILSVPNSAQSFLQGINTAGQMVGAYFDLSGNVHGFLTDGTTFTTLDYPGSIATEPTGINDSGQIVGDYADASSNPHGFLYSSGVFTSIDISGSTGTNVEGNNSAGDVVGLWKDSASNLHSFLMHSGAITSLDFPLATFTEPFGINDSGEVAGTYDDAAGVSHGFIYSDGAFSRVDVAGAAATVLTRIKNSGAITGEFTDALTRLTVSGVIKSSVRARLRLGMAPE